MDMRHHRFGLRSVVDLRERVRDLILAEGTAVELVDALTDHHAGLLLDELRELARVVLLDGHDPLRAPEDLANLRRREWLHETALQEIDLLALRLEHLERVEDRSLGRAPREHGELGVLRPVEVELLLIGDRVLRELELAHALFHHRDTHLDAFGDVSVRVMLVARYPVPATLDARARAWGDPILRERVAQVLLHVREIQLPLAVPFVP